MAHHYGPKLPPPPPPPTTGPSLKRLEQLRANFDAKSWNETADADEAAFVKAAQSRRKIMENREAHLTRDKKNALKLYGCEVL